MQNDKTTKPSGKISYLEHFKIAISGMMERSQEIVLNRYGANGRREMTLEEIGKKYSVTRERVRQVIREVLKKVKERIDDEEFKDVRDAIVLAVNQSNGIMEESRLLTALSKNSRKESGSARFFLECVNDVNRLEIRGELKRSYAIEGFDLDRWRTVKEVALAVLKERNQPMVAGDLHAAAQEKLTGMDISEESFFDFLAVSEQVKPNTFGKWGISTWREITPKGTRDKAYLVLKEAGKPLHFRGIAAQIDAHGLGKKKTHPQTVHNELIKDSKFVLVGRGTYALAEWGYKKGTVKDVIEDILKKSAKPMTKDEIIRKVLEVRQVKKTTIVINLNNFFKKTSSGEYTLKK